MRLGRIQNNYTAEGFDLAAAQGMEFIEICCNYDEDAQKLIAAQDDVKAQIARTGIDVSCVGRWNHHVQHDGAIDAENAQLYYDLLDTAIALGAKTFVCGCNYDESVSRYRNYTTPPGGSKSRSRTATGTTSWCRRTTGTWCSGSCRS